MFCSLGQQKNCLKVLWSCWHCFPGFWRTLKIIKTIFSRKWNLNFGSSRLNILQPTKRNDWLPKHQFVRKYIATHILEKKYKFLFAACFRLSYFLSIRSLRWWISEIHDKILGWFLFTKHKTINTSLFDITQVNDSMVWSNL